MVIRELTLPCLLFDEASACGAKSRPSWIPISFLVSERLRRQGLQATAPSSESPVSDWEAKARPWVPRPRILEHVYGAVGRLPACALLRWPLLPSDGRHPPIPGYIRGVDDVHSR